MPARFLPQTEGWNNNQIRKQECKGEKEQKTERKEAERRVIAERKLGDTLNLNARLKSASRRETKQARFWTLSTPDSTGRTRLQSLEAPTHTDLNALTRHFPSTHTSFEVTLIQGVPSLTRSARRT